MLPITRKSTWTVSLFALITTNKFAADCSVTYLLGAPKATGDLHKVFLPPMVKMQTFVFLFDTIIALYYVYQLPIWDWLKNKFPFFQYDSKIVEEPDCASLLLHVLLVFLSKVSINLNKLVIGIGTYDCTSNITLQCEAN